jgi:heme/copper-type cytochrome/quinol oxidase subunit 2
VVTEVFLGLLAAAAVIGLLWAIVATALKLRPAEQAKSDVPASRTWASLATMVVFLLLVILGIPTFVTLFSN